MWVKRTEAEIAEERKQQRRRRLRAAMLFGAFIFVTFTFYSGRRHGRLLVHANEILSHLPFAVMVGFIGTLMWYNLERKPMMICPQCEASKYEDGVTQCPCGGHFEMMESMKFVA